jgi:hypothetical protein
MASRKEEKERLRSERLEAEKREAAQARQRLMVGYALAGALALAVLVGLVVVIAGGGGGGGSSDGGSSPANAHIVTGIVGSETFGVPADGREGTQPPPVKQADLTKAAQEAGCDLQLNLPDEGNSHVGGHVTYHTSPPTSGNHNPVPQADGAYSEEPQPEHFVHSLEHGRVEIQYSPDLPEKDQLALKGVFQDSPGGMLLFPNPDMPYEVAATAWTQLVGCKRYEGAKTLDVIQDFRDQYRGRGPEAIPFPDTPSDFG